MSSDNNEQIPAAIASHLNRLGWWDGRIVLIKPANDSANYAHFSYTGTGMTLRSCAMLNSASVFSRRVSNVTFWAYSFRIN